MRLRTGSRFNISSLFNIGDTPLSDQKYVKESPMRQLIVSFFPGLLQNQLPDRGTPPSMQSMWTTAIMKTHSRFLFNLCFYNNKEVNLVGTLFFQEPPAVSSLPSFSHGSVPSKLEALAREKQLKHEYPLFKVSHREVFLWLDRDFLVLWTAFSGSCKKGYLFKLLTSGWW